MTQQFLEETKRELINGHSKKRHPYRYFVLATTENGKPQQRTVVLRKTLQDLGLVFYTDSRTPKIKAIQESPDISALFYHPKQLLQIRVEGRAEIITDTTEIARYWHTVQSASRNDYTTKESPGTSINNPDAVDYNPDDNYFCPVKIIPTKIEYLRLKRPNHLRILFSKEGDAWSGQFLVP